jgi:hypothetical protein
MMRQHVDPVLAEVFHYTRAWLQEVAVRSIGLSVDQIKTARQMDLPARLAIPMRVISSAVAIACRFDAHVPTKSLTADLIPGFTA